MAKTTFVDRQTKIVAEWLNEVNVATFDAIGDGTNAPTTAAEVRTNIGAGDVNGPVVATNNNVAVFDQTTGKLIKDGGATLASKANSGTNSDITSATALAALPAVTSGSVFRKNAIINGDFQVWQEGTSFVAMANGQYVADNWQYAKVGTMVHSAFQSADVPTIVQAGRKIPYSLLIDCTTADASIAAGDLCTINTYLEGYNFVPIAGVGLCHQFWHKHTKTGTYCIRYSNSGSDRSFVREYTQDVADTWEFATVLIDASPSAGTWDYGNGLGLTVRFALAVGSTFQTTAGAWNVGNFLGTANQVNACDSVANNFMLAGVQLEKGSVATEFDVRTFHDELTANQRYYCKSYNYSVTPGTSTDAGALQAGNFAAGVAPTISSRFPVAMRTAPTVVTYSRTGTINTLSDAASANQASTADWIGETGFRMFITAGTLTSVSGHYTASARF